MTGLGYLASADGLAALKTLISSMRELGVSYFEVDSLKVQIGSEPAPVLQEPLVEMEEVSDEDLLLDPMAGVKLSRPKLRN